MRVPLLIVFQCVMTPERLNDIAGQLESAGAELIAAVSSLTEEQARTRPAPERWSVLECLEHVCYVERRFLRMVRESETVRPAKRDAAKEAALMERVTDRSNRRSAPEALPSCAPWPAISFVRQRRAREAGG
jgi:uncharacterized damage-inducible protein DinB